MRLSHVILLAAALGAAAAASATRIVIRVLNGPPGGVAAIGSKVRSKGCGSSLRRHPREPGPPLSSAA